MSNHNRKAGVPILVFVLLCAVGAVAFVRYFVLGVPVITYNSGLVASGVVRRPLDTLAVHASRENFLRVGGKIYRRVRGLQPFYLRLPQLQSILFITDVGRDGADFHIVRTNDWSELRIRGEKLSFGGHIGDPDPAGSPYTDFVEKEDNGELVLATKYPRARTLVFLDLKERKVSKVVYNEFDEAGRTNSQSVYVDGRQVR